MALTRTRITGFVQLPNGDVPFNGRVIFQLSGWDKSGGNLLVPAPIEAQVSASGEIDIMLQTTTETDRGLAYSVSVAYFNKALQRRERVDLPNVAVPAVGPVTLAALLALPAPPVNDPDVLAQIAALTAQALAAANSTAKTLIDAAAVKDDRIATEVARDAAIAAGNWDYTPVDDAALAAITGMTAGQTAYVRQTMHVWNYSGSAWVDTGESPLAGKANRTDLLAEVSDRKQLISERDPFEEDLLLAVQGASGGVSFLEARLSSPVAGGYGGGPTDLSVILMDQNFTASGRRFVRDEAAVGMGDYGLFIEAPTADGRKAISPDFALDADLRYREQELRSLFARAKSLGISISGGVEVLPDGTYQRGLGDFPQAEVDTKKWAGWGSSSMSAMGSSMAAVAADFGAAYYNGGRGGNVGPEILARMGEQPYLLGPFNLPAEIVSVVVPTTPSWGYGSPGAAQPGTLMVDPPVKGSLFYEAGTYNRTFTRDVAGAAVSVPDGTVFVPDTVQFRDAVAFLNIAKNSVNGVLTGTQLANFNLRAWTYLAGVFRRVIVIGQFPNSSHLPGGHEFNAITEWNNIDAKRYEKFFVPIMPWLTSQQAFTDLGITPTDADLQYQAEGRVPPSLMADNAHLIGPAYAWIAKVLVRNALLSYSWLKEL